MSDKLAKSRTKQLQEILSSGKRLLIFNHFNPDPDSLTAAFILSEMAKSFKVKSRIVYSGDIVYSKNLAMVTYLNFKVHPFIPGEEAKYDLIAIVDTQKGMSNNAIPTHIFPNLTFDHHPRLKSQRNHPKNQGYFLKDVRPQYGSAASILLEYYFNLGLELTPRIATAFCYTIIAETDHFNRKYNEVDVRFYRRTVAKADLRLISKIMNTKRPVTYFQVLKRAITIHVKEDTLLTCALGKIPNLDFLHEIANFMLTMDGVEFVVITGTREGVKKICCRSSIPSIHIGNILKTALTGLGTGGGHETMAAGEFKGQEEKVIQSFKTYLQKSHAIQG